MKSTTRHRRRKRGSQQIRGLRLERLEDRCLLAVNLVADINQAGAGGNPSQFTAVGDVAFFAAHDIVRGTELWKTNGTVAGTRFVKDINPGAPGGYPNSSEPLHLTNVNGTLFFSAFHPDFGRELWKSNGTAAGTVLVKDIMSGSEGAEPGSLVKSGNLLYFSAFDDPTSGSQLWKSNGTSNGSVLLTQNGLGDSPFFLIDVNGSLYFVGGAGPGKQALYRTAGGTPTAVPIPLSGSFSIGWLENVNDVLYFSTSSAEGNILWRTNGTTTTQVFSLPAGFENRISFLTDATGTLYGTVGGDRLYKFSPGAATLLATITPGNIGPLTAVGGKVFFVANDGINGEQLWISRGTPASTKLVKVIGSGFGTQFPSNLTNINGVLYFAADDGINGREIWKSDGTAAGTKMVENLNPGTGSSNPRWITSFKGTALFQATDNVKGSQVYKSNGTIAGTFAISNLNPLATKDAFPSKITDVGGIAYFFADDGIHGRELWKSDGTTSGTMLVADINPGPAGSQQQPGSYADPVNVNGTLYFVANDGQRGAELWKSNASGTSLVKNINPGSGSSNVGKLTAVGNTLYFTATDGANGIRLWKTSGTAAGTVPLGPAHANPSNLTSVNGTLFFSAADETNGTELWKSNGTPAGTVLVRDIKSGSASSFPNELTNVNGTLFFSADDGISGRQLWKSSGTAAGTVTVQAMGPTFPHELTNVRGTLFFAATDSTGTHLWKSNGTSQGTTRVLGENPSPDVQYPDQLTNVNGSLFFVAGSDSYYDRDLWKSDGTAAGTMLVPNAFNPKELTAAGSTLYFTMRDSRGEALWKSDGTVTGTVQLQLFGDGSYNYINDYPSNLASVGGQLFFSAGDLRYGNELRIVTESASSTAGTAVSTSAQRKGTIIEKPAPWTLGGAAESNRASLAGSTHQIESSIPIAVVKTARPKKRSPAGQLELSAAAIDLLLSDPVCDWHSAWAARIPKPL
jgi:ELWxxDGT repeat protein